MARTAKAAKELVERLSRPGDAEVLHGDLALVGLPGLVYTPAAGTGLPAVAIGHGWMQPARRYRHLLRHLASWGIVALAPDTQRGPFPSVRALAADLRTALDVSTGVRLGGAGSAGGTIRVDPQRLALAGHGIGGGAAVLAAERDNRVRAVALLAPAQTHPSASAAAGSVTVPGLVLVAERDNVATPVAHAEPIAANWAGPVSVRTVRKASHLGFLDGRHWADVLIDGKPERATRKITLALLTAFLLKQLTGTDDYDALLDHDVRQAPMRELDPMVSASS